MAKSLSSLITGSRSDERNRRRRKRPHPGLSNPRYWKQPARGSATYGKYKS